jgi:3'-5' exoribonuclease
MVATQIEKIPEFPKELEMKILHIILSHHGQLENGSPVKPMFSEAVAFAHIDDTDATTQHTKQMIQRDESEKTWIYSRMDGNWTYTK